MISLKYRLLSKGGYIQTIVLYLPYDAISAIDITNATQELLVDSFTSSKASTIYLYPSDINVPSFSLIQDLCSTILQGYLTPPTSPYSSITSPVSVS